MTDQEFDEVWARVVDRGRREPTSVADVLIWLAYPDLDAPERERHVTELAQELAHG